MPKQSDGLTLYLIIAVVLTDTIITLSALYAIFYAKADSWAEIGWVIGQGAGIAVAATIVIMANSEVILLISERYRMKRYNEGKAEGKAEGKVEGIKETSQKWEEWNNRRLSAEAKGEKFDEPPPVTLTTGT